MNTILNGDQGNTRRGDVTKIANSNLTGKQNYIWKVVSIAGVSGFDLASLEADTTAYVGMSGDIQGAPVAAEAPDLNDECRVAIDSTTAINPGDKLAISLVTPGQLCKPAAGYGNGFYTFEAQDGLAAGAATAGTLLKVRKICDRAFNL